MFDPDNAVGVVLDQRVAINGIQRQAGTYTVTPITVVTSQSVNLYGLDQDVQPVYHRLRQRREPLGAPGDPAWRHRRHPQL
jgi:hypothetical protein